MRTVYSRTAFQDSAGPAVRVSLDMQLHMLREEHPEQAGNWCRDIRYAPQQFWVTLMAALLPLQRATWVFQTYKPGWVCLACSEKKIVLLHVLAWLSNRRCITGPGTK